MSRWNYIIWLLICIALVCLSAKPYAGSWNDGSRLATAQSMVEQGTFIIDDSIHLNPQASQLRPYTEEMPTLNDLGTMDKLYIKGHYYSDKSPVPNVLLAAIYWCELQLGMPSASQRPDLFAYTLTLLTSGVSYVIAVLAILALSGSLFAKPWQRHLFTASFAFSTFALIYTQYVNSHIMQLAVVALLSYAGLDNARLPRMLFVGSLLGFGYTLDLGVGPVLVVVTIGSLTWYTRSLKLLLLVILGSAPCIILHHILNYHIGGTLVPANANPDYLTWPGSPFNPENMTGGFKHTWWFFPLYTIDMMVGKNGFLSHSIPLWLLPGAIVILYKRGKQERRILAFALLWVLGAWLLYAAASNNYAGGGIAIRWFVPFLAPGYWIVGRLMKAEPRYWPDFIWLSIVGLGLAMAMQLVGMWTIRMVPGLWAFMAIAGVGWGIVRVVDITKRSTSAV